MSICGLFRTTQLNNNRLSNIGDHLQVAFANDSTLYVISTLLKHDKKNDTKTVGLGDSNLNQVNGGVL